MRDFNDSRPLSTDDLPLIFKDTKVMHVCNMEIDDDCNCVDHEMLDLWVVAKDCSVTLAVWGVKGERYLTFYDGRTLKKMPPVLKTMETLDFLLQVGASKIDSKILFADEPRRGYSLLVRIKEGLPRLFRRPHDTRLQRQGSSS